MATEDIAQPRGWQVQLRHHVILDVDSFVA